MGHEWGWGFMGFGWILWIVILALIIWVVVRLTSQNGGQRGPSSPRETPLDILKRRYANGEITKEQYDQMKKDLES